MRFRDIEVDDEWLEERAHEDYLNPRNDEAQDLSDLLVRVVSANKFAPPSGRVARGGETRGIVIASAVNPRQGSMAGTASASGATPVRTGNPPSPSRGAGALPLPRYGGPRGEWHRHAEGRRKALAGAQLEYETQQLIARLRRSDGTTRPIWGVVPSASLTPVRDTKERATTTVRAERPESLTRGTR